MRTKKRQLQQHFHLEVQEFKPIPEKREDVARVKAYARKNTMWLGHRLGSWKKWIQRELGGTFGWIRTAKCRNCGQKIFIHAQGTVIGFPKEMQCPKDPNRQF